VLELTRAHEEQLERGEVALNQVASHGIKTKLMGAARATIRIQAKSTELECANEQIRTGQVELQKVKASHKDTKVMATAKQFGGMMRAGIKVREAEQLAEKERAMNQEWRRMATDQGSAEDDIAKFVLARAMGMDEEQQNNLKFELTKTMERLPVFLRNVVAMVKTTCEATCGISYDIQPAAKAINNAVMQSKEAYNKAVGAIIRVEGGEKPLNMVRAMKPEDFCDQAQGILLQAESCDTCDGLLREATEAQKKLKADILASIGGKAALTEPQYNWQPKRDFRVPNASWFSSLLDPGVKREMRCKQKVEIKYPDLGFRRILDAARLAVVCDTCARMKQAVERLSHIFDVVEMENRHTQPTALGWSDVQLLVRIRLGGGRTHIAEIQVQHELLYNARKTVHTHYTTLREALPLECCVLPKDLDAVIEATLAAYDYEYDKSKHEMQNSYIENQAKKARRLTQKKKKAAKGVPQVKSRLHAATAASRANRAAHVVPTTPVQAGTRRMSRGVQDIHELRGMHSAKRKHTKLGALKALGMGK
jgi:hypothetical protein